MATEKIDAALARYYKALNKEYDHLFLNYCEENGLDDETLAEELEQSPEDSMLVDFDENFPFKKQPKNAPNAVFDIIRKCRDNPDICFEFISRMPVFDQDLFKTIDKKDLEQIIPIYQQQCPKISSLFTDNYFIPVLTVGRKHNFDYLLHLVDDYTRDRLDHFNRTWTEQNWSHMHKHFHRLKDLKVNIPRFEYNKNDCCFKTIIARVPYIELVTDLVRHFNRNCFPKLIFSNMMVINDSIKTIAKYINEAVKFVADLAANKSAAPFQFDVCIVTGSPRPIQNRQRVGHEDDSDDSDAYEEFKPLEEKVDCIGNIKDKLIKNGLHFNLKTNDGKIDSGMFSDIYTEFKTKNKLEDSNDFDFLYRKRLLVMIDRRKSNGKDAKMNDAIWMYESPINCRTIPNNPVPEWYINSSKTCLLPNMAYAEDMHTDMHKIDCLCYYWARKDNVLFFKDAQFVIFKFYDKTDMRDDENKIKYNNRLRNANISTDFHCKGWLLTFSFHVKAKDVIKCYMYWNGQMIKFLPQDIKTSFTKVFDMAYDGNQEYITGNKELDTMIEEMKKKLVDKEFEAFQDSYA